MGLLHRLESTEEVQAARVARAERAHRPALARRRREGLEASQLPLDGGVGGGQHECLDEAMGLRLIALAEQVHTHRAAEAQEPQQRVGRQQRQRRAHGGEDVRHGGGAGGVVHKEEGDGRRRLSRGRIRRRRDGGSVLLRLPAATHEALDAGRRP